MHLLCSNVKINILFSLGIFHVLYICFYLHTTIYPISPSNNCIKTPKQKWVICMLSFHILIIKGHLEYNSFSCFYFPHSTTFEQSNWSFRCLIMAEKDLKITPFLYTSAKNPIFDTVNLLNIKIDVFYCQIIDIFLSVPKAHCIYDNAILCWINYGW